MRRGDKRDTGNKEQETRNTKQKEEKNRHEIVTGIAGSKTK